MEVKSSRYNISSTAQLPASSICLPVLVAKHMWAKLKDTLRSGLVSIFKVLRKRMMNAHFPYILFNVMEGTLRGLKVKGIYSLNLPTRRGDFDRILIQKEKFGIDCFTSEKVKHRVQYICIFITITGDPLFTLLK